MKATEPLGRGDGAPGEQDIAKTPPVGAHAQIAVASADMEAAEVLPRGDGVPGEQGVAKDNATVCECSAAQRAELLLHEIDETGRKIDAYVRLDATLLSIALSLFTASLGLGLSRGYRELLIGLPFTFGLYFCIQQRFHAEFMGLAGYKCALETKVTQLVGPVAFWESEIIAPSRHRPKTSILIWTTFAIIYCAGATAAIIEAVKYGELTGWPHHHATLLLTLTACSIVIGALLSGIAVVFSLSEFERTKAISEDVLTAATSRPANPSEISSTLPVERDSRQDVNPAPKV